MKLFLSLLAFMTVTSAVTKSRPCDTADEALLADQRQILDLCDSNIGNDAAWMKSISRPLGCLLQTQEDEKGMTKYYAGSLLRPLLGNDVVDGLPQDARFAKIALRLQHVTENAPDIMGASLVTLFAAGEWGFFAPSATKNKIGPVFLPEADSIRHQPPVIAAAGVLHLRNAYRVLRGAEKAQAAARIRELYRTLPKTARIQREVIDRVYAEVFGAPVRGPHSNGLS